MVELLHCGSHFRPYTASGAAACSVSRGDFHRLPRGQRHYLSTPGEPPASPLLTSILCNTVPVRCMSSALMRYSQQHSESFADSICRRLLQQHQCACVELEPSLGVPSKHHKCGANVRFALADLNMGPCQTRTTRSNATYESSRTER